jgi:hypothetical protein
MTKSWTIVGKDLIKEVTCAEPYEWKDPTGEEWEFAEAGEHAALHDSMMQHAAAVLCGAGSPRAPAALHAENLRWPARVPPCR